MIQVGPCIVVLRLHLEISICNEKSSPLGKICTQSGKISNSRLATPPDDESEMIPDIRFDESQMISENLGRILKEYLGIIS